MRRWWKLFMLELDEDSALGAIHHHLMALAVCEPGPCYVAHEKCLADARNRLRRTRSAIAMLTPPDQLLDEALRGRR